MSGCPDCRPSRPDGAPGFPGRRPVQWREKENGPFQRGRTTILFGGLTPLRDSLVMAALRSLGENFRALPQPDMNAFRTGKAYGNRGQCNPTYFTVGNLVNYLVRLRDEEGIPTERILKEYCFVTAGGCGPCRFGMYVTEYRKALRDAGFEGFRVFEFDHTGSIFQKSGGKEGFLFSPRFFLTLLRAIVVGDILTLRGFQMRPYETEKGSVDEALRRCRAVAAEALEAGGALLPALYRCKKILNGVRLERTKRRPGVMVIGEFWAAMTEGEGNYRLFRFLEEEGCEVMTQPVTARLLVNIWEAKHEAAKRSHLPGEGPFLDPEPLKRFLINRLGRFGLRAQWRLYAVALGLKGYRLPDVDRLAELAEPWFTLDATGGEGHMEVGHFIECAEKGCADLVISVKPFGCMPSSAVSDGIQSLVTARYPNLPFLAVETSGEGAVNFYSRIQMLLHRMKNRKTDA